MKNTIDEYRNEDPVNLDCEALEERMMLSTVTIYAAGATGQESLDLIIDGEVAYTYERVRGNIDTRTLEVYRFRADNDFSADDIQLRFTNDVYDPAKGIDRNILIDKITVDGLTYEAESPTTHLDAWWGNGGLQEDGNFETELMNVNSTLSFRSISVPEVGSEGTRIRVEAKGDTGEEKFELRVEDETLAVFQVGTEEGSFIFRADGLVDPSSIQIVFINDQYDSAKGIDRNLTVRQIQLIDVATEQRTIYQTDSDDVLSTGTWLPADGVATGLGRGNTLHANGFFQYGQNDSGVHGRSLDAVLDQFERENVGTVNPVLQVNTEYFDSQGREYLIAGSRGNAQEILVVRLLSDGTVDPTYGVNGLSVVPLETVPSEDGTLIGQGSFEAMRLAFDSQDRAYAVTRVTANIPVVRGGATRWFGVQVSRLDANGALDNSFGTGGTAVAPYVQGASTNVRSIAIDANDRLTVTGNKVEPTTTFRLGETFGVADELTTTTLVELAGGEIELVEFAVA